MLTCSVKVLVLALVLSTTRTISVRHQLLLLLLLLHTLSLSVLICQRLETQPPLAPLPCRRPVPVLRRALRLRGLTILQPRRS